MLGNQDKRKSRSGGSPILEAGTEGAIRHGAERSGVSQLEWRLPKSAESGGKSCHLRFVFCKGVVDIVRRQVAESFVGPPTVVAFKPGVQACSERDDC